MAYLLLIVIVVLAIVLLDIREKYHIVLKENKILKQELKKIKSQNLNSFDSTLDTSANNNNTTTTSQNDNIVSTTSNKVTGYHINSNESTPSNMNVSQGYKIGSPSKKAVAQKVKIDKTEQKNITILITGAICIILAAIIFLSSTWSAIPNLLKTAVIILLTFVFLGASKLAQEKFNLPKTGKTFFYIAMAYIPISLLSISIFGLFGEYLSINGDGNYLYLALSSILVAIIYYMIYKKYNNKYMLYGSILSQVFTIVATNLIFGTEILAITITLLLYNILLIMLTPNCDLLKNVYAIIPVLMSLFSIGTYGENGYLFSFTLLLTAANFLILLNKYPNKFYAYLFNIIDIYFGLCLFSTIFDPDNQTIIIESCLIVYLIINYIAISMLYKKNKLIIDSLNVTNIISLTLFNLFVFFEESTLIQVVYSSTLTLLLMINYFNPANKDNHSKKMLFSILASISYFGTAFVIFDGTNFHSFWVLLVGFITLLCTILIKKRDNLLFNVLLVATHIFLGLNYAIIMEEFSTDNKFILLISSILMFIGYIYSYLITKFKIFKYLTYISITPMISSTLNLITQELYPHYIGVTVSVMFAMLVETLDERIEDKYSDIFFAVVQGLSYSLFIFDSDIYSSSPFLIVYLLAYTLLIGVYNKYVNKNTLYNLVPLIGIAPILFVNNCSRIFMISTQLLSLILVTAISIPDKDFSIYRGASFVYLLLFSILITNEYLIATLIILWSLLQIVTIKSKGLKDVLKVIIYLAFFFIYSLAINDLKLDDTIIFPMIGYLIMAIVLFRTIINKYMNNEDITIIEHLAYSIIYLITISNITSITVGIVFIGLLLVTLILSYLLRYGTLFITSIAALLVSIFVLTKEFWFSIPWWIYLLGIGTILIAFAIRNEVSDKKDKKTNPIDFINKLKDTIEK